MVGPLLLLSGLCVAAPVPRVPSPSAEVKRVAVPPVLVDFGGQLEWLEIDEGYHAEVTVVNRGRKPLRVEHVFAETDPVDVRWTNSDGKVVSTQGHHIGIHSPFAPGTPEAATKVRVIKPGGKLTVLVDLRQDLPEKSRVRGKYKVVVTVRTDAGPLTSAPLAVELK